MKREYRLAFALTLILLNLGCQSDYRVPNSLGELPPGEGLVICSPLDFSKVNWTTTFTSLQQQAFELALNISGSYEGPDAWANLTNNFDGQGLSMGLLNQNLGQNSLQPLLVEMRNNHLSTMQSIFSSSDLQSLLGMLSTWEASQPQLTGLNANPVNKLDSTTTSTPNASVQWAVNTLYNGSNFIPQWQTELTNLGQTPEYISIQVEAALALHNQTMNDFNKLNVLELRAYLMIFDIEVQDGGIYAQDFTDYNTWLSQNPQSSDTDRLVELLTLRLRHVLSQYVADVQSRKMAIINGSGVVHGESRNLQIQYCYNGLISYPN